MEIEDLIKISEHVAYRTDWVQGAGGNTSVKKDNGELLIKASGKLLKEVAALKTFASVKQEPILTVLKEDSFDVKNNIDLQKLDSTVTKSCHPNMQGFVPSMETSFHCLYGKYVLHTHNVYANVFLCSSHYHLLESCFTGEENYTVSLLEDYCTPGAELSWYLYDAYRFEPQMPNITFLPNHGIIFSHDSVKELLEMHDAVQEKLERLLEIKTENYPKFTASTFAETIVVDVPFLFFVWETMPWNLVVQEILFPDQAIYIHEQDISDTNQLAKVFINWQLKKLICRCSSREADGIVENMLAYFFMRKQMQEKGYEPLTINFELEKLRNMQTEIYRKQQLK